MITDDDRLSFLMQDVDSYFKVEKDRYEYAMEVMEENGRESYTYEDELEGFRRMVDEAIRVHNYTRE